MASIFDWSGTASSNTSVDGININTGMSPANVDNAFRSLMSIIRQTFGAAIQLFLVDPASNPLGTGYGGTGANTPSGALTSLGALSVAYRDLPITGKSGNFTFADSERGGGILCNGGSPSTATINPHASTAITVGAVYIIYNISGGSVTVARGAGVTLAKNGSTSSSDAVIAQGAQATLIQWGTDTWTINGVGVS